MPTAGPQPAEARLPRHRWPTGTSSSPIDDKVVALYQQNTPASTDAADALILGDGYNVYYEIIKLTTTLRSSMEKRAAQATAAADAQQTSDDPADRRGRSSLGRAGRAGRSPCVVARRIVRPLGAVMAVADGARRR